jgi:Sigma-70 region 2
MEAEASGAVERARSGDNDAFRLLVEQHGRAIFRLAYRMTGNKEDAEDGDFLEGLPPNRPIRSARQLFYLAV